MCETGYWLHLQNCFFVISSPRGTMLSGKSSRLARRPLCNFHVVFALQEFAPDRVLVRYKPGLVIPQSHSRLGLTLAKQVGRQRTQVYRITNGNSVNYTLEQLRSIPGASHLVPGAYSRLFSAAAQEDPFLASNCFGAHTVLLQFKSRLLLSCDAQELRPLVQTTSSAQWLSMPTTPAFQGSGTCRPPKQRLLGPPL